MHTIGQLKSRILDVVSRAPDRRIRPIDLERTIVGKGDSSKAVLKQALNALVEAAELIYTYRDPCSFLELPIASGQITQ